MAGKVGLRSLRPVHQVTWNNYKGGVCCDGACDDGRWHQRQGSTFLGRTVDKVASEWPSQATGYEKGNPTFERSCPEVRTLFQCRSEDGRVALYTIHASNERRADKSFLRDSWSRAKFRDRHRRNDAMAWMTRRRRKWCQIGQTRLSRGSRGRFPVAVPAVSLGHGLGMETAGMPTGTGSGMKSRW